MVLQPVTQNRFLKNGEIKYFGEISCIGLIPIPVQKHKRMQCTKSTKKGNKDMKSDNYIYLKVERAMAV